MLELEDQYRRSEEPYSGPEDFSGTAYAGWDDSALYLAVAVTKPELCFRAPPGDAPLLRLDNEPEDIHSDGLQVYVRHPETGDVAGFLVEPQDLVNIAHVVRALKNFGFRDLRLVRPREFDAYRIEGIAHQTQDVLARVTRYERLDDALADCVHVVGFTARERSAKRNRQRPREAAAELLAQAEVGTVALLFGREDKGLPNEALDRCHRLVTIPTDPGYASLQLDRKSTRLNSSHSQISYAVFCLKKKKTKSLPPRTLD